MNRSIGIGLAATIVVAALVGIQVVGGQRHGAAGATQTPAPPPSGSPVAAETPSPTSSLSALGPSATLSPLPSVGSPSSSPELNYDPTGLGGPTGASIQGGPLDAGTYTFSNFGGFSLHFTVPAGWTWAGQSLVKGGGYAPDGAAIYFLTGPVQVYPDPCHWMGAQTSPLTGTSVDDLVAALVAQPGRGATVPVARNMNGRSGIAVELAVPVYVDIATCDGGQYRIWGPGNTVRSIQETQGPHDLVWAVDVSGNGVAFEGASGIPSQRLIIDAASFPGAPASTMAEIDAVLRSIGTCHCGP
jgi:hypothetical protein